MVELYTHNYQIMSYNVISVVDKYGDPEKQKERARLILNSVFETKLKELKYYNLHSRTRLQWTLFGMVRNNDYE